MREKRYASLTVFQYFGTPALRKRTRSRKIKNTDTLTYWYRDTDLKMLLYYITDRRQFPGSAAEQRHRLVQKIGEAAKAGIDLIQLRERDLSGRDLEALAAEAVAAVRSARTKTRILINSRADIALACGADGVHLRSDDIAASDARAIAGRRSEFVVGVSCHSVDQVRQAWSHGADFAVFGAVFEKDGNPGSGLSALRATCESAKGLAVLALGGVTVENADACRAAGAAGIAGIRLFQNSDAATLVILRKHSETSPKQE